MAFVFTRIFRYFIFATLAFSGIQYALRHVPYTFSPKVFRTSAEKFAGQLIATSLPQILVELRGKYNPHIQQSVQWNHITVNGVHTRVLLLHGSLTEYMAIWGAPFGGRAHIGTHWINQTCTVLQGAVHKSIDDSRTDAIEHYENGANFRLNAFEPTILDIAHDTWALCYGRGFMPISTVHLMTGTLLEAGDVVSLAKFMYRYADSTIREQSMFWPELMHSLKRKLF